MKTQHRIPSSADFEELSSKEWLVTNGIGGFAHSTLSGAHTRRYHGWLVASLNPPVQRMVLLSKIEEAIASPDGGWMELSANAYPGVIHPSGYLHLAKFKRDPLPEFHFEANELKLSRTLFMPQGKNAVVMEYENKGKKEIRIKLVPFLVYRDYHHLMTARNDFPFRMSRNGKQMCSVEAFDGAMPLYFHFTSGDFTENRHWYLQHIYAKETYRGLDDREDTFTPGYMLTTIPAGKKFYVVAGLEKDLDTWVPETLKKVELERLDAIVKSSPLVAKAKKLEKYDRKPAAPWHRILADLSKAGDQFIVRRTSTNGYSVLAGYPWFTDWGRDTMIAMRGLVIAQGHRKLAESIITTFLDRLEEGLLPNRFPDSGEAPEYNTMDATLWLFIVLHDYMEKFGHKPFLKKVLPKLDDILLAHLKGTKFGIHMTDEGLLSGGSPLVQLTWMDAKVGNVVVTPREGCPVEINALWYNAIVIHGQIGQFLGRKKMHHEELAQKVKKSFNRYFWNGEYLDDVVVPGEKADSSFRPNQIYAVSLPFRLLSSAKEAVVLRTVRQKLLTPYGLRSLDPEDGSFVAHYGGGPWERDHAYHQGTVWAFLFGEFAIAWLRHHKFSVEAKADILKWCKPMIHHFYQADCLHGISEIFDGAMPKEGRGCCHQAWSVGMLLTTLDQCG